MQRAWRRTAGAGTLGNLPTRPQRVASFLLVRATTDGRGATGSPRQCSSSRAVLAGQQQQQERWRPAAVAARLCTNSNNPQTTTRLLAVDTYEKKATDVPRIARSNNVTFAPARSAVPARTRDKNMYSAPLVVCQQQLLGHPSGVVWRCSGLPSATFWKRFLSYTGRSFSSNNNDNKNQNPDSSSCNTHNRCHAGPKQQSAAQPTPTSTTTPWLSTVTTTSDPPVWTWVERVLPLYWQPYARLARFDKPIGTMLLVSMNLLA